MKPKIYFKFLLLMVIMGSAFKGYSQQTGAGLNQKRQQRNFYRKSLQIDSVKAEQVVMIQDSYKAGLKLVMADTGLNDAAKRVRIKALMERKNQKLRLLLSPAQQEKIIPSSERMPAKEEK